MIEFKRRRWNSGRTKLKDRPLDDALVSICLAEPPVRYLEIGTREGGSLLAVLEHADPAPELIVICDTWGPAHGGTGRGSHDHISALLDARGFSGDVRFYDGRSQETVPRIRLRRFDLITVDGSHAAPDALEDLENAWPLLRPGGLLVFDDTNTPALGEIVVGWSKRPDAELAWASGRRPGVAVLRKLDGSGGE